MSADKEYDEELEDYLSLADEMNDDPDGVWVEADWDARAVASGKRYAKKHGLRWPPGFADYDHFFET